MRIRAIFLLAPLLFLFWSCAHPPEFLQEDVPLLEEVEVGKELFPWAVQKMGGVYSENKRDVPRFPTKFGWSIRLCREDLLFPEVISELPGGCC